MLFFLSVLLSFFTTIIDSKVRIILIGIQKSGTTSYHEWFEKIGLKSAHHIVKEGFVAAMIHQAKSNRLPMLHHLNHYDVISELNKDTPTRGRFS